MRRARENVDVRTGTESRELIQGQASRPDDEGSKGIDELHLTSKQRRFVEFYMGEAKGIGVRAAEMAGYGGGYKGQAAAAHHNLRNPAVVEAMKRLGGGSTSSVGLKKRDELMQFWSNMLQSPATSDRDKLKASELLAKAEGLFIERREISGRNGAPMTILADQLSDDELATIAVYGCLPGEEIIEGDHGTAEPEPEALLP